MEPRHRIVLSLFLLILATAPVMAVLEPARDIAFVPLPIPIQQDVEGTVELTVRIDGEIRIREIVAFDHTLRPAFEKRAVEKGRAENGVVELLATAPELLAHLRALESDGGVVEIVAEMEGVAGETFHLRDIGSTPEEGWAPPARATSMIEVDGMAWTGQPVAAKVGTCLSLCETVFNGCMSACAGNAACESACTFRRNRCVSSCNQCTPDTWGTIDRVPVGSSPASPVLRCYQQLFDPAPTYYNYLDVDRKTTITTYSRDTSCTVTTQVDVAYDMVRCWNDLGGSSIGCPSSAGPPPVDCGHLFLLTHF